jgi:hypothetical protein
VLEVFRRCCRLYQLGIECLNISPPPSSISDGEAIMVAWTQDSQGYLGPVLRYRAVMILLAVPRGRMIISHGSMLMIREMPLS